MECDICRKGFKDGQEHLRYVETFAGESNSAKFHLRNMLEFYIPLEEKISRLAKQWKGEAA